jgi:hypothetical protein
MNIDYTSQDTIFVQIASYRDPELQHTLQDLFKKAKKPENIFVGICHQYDMKGDEDKHLFEVPFPRPNQLRICEVDYPDAKGLFFARSKTQSLYRGEKWTAQFDSHMRFEEGWDEILVKMVKDLQSQGHKKPIVASYPPGYNPETNELNKQFLTFLRIDRFIKTDGIIRISGWVNNSILHCTPTAFISGNFFFTVGEHVKEIPYDIHMYFTDEQNIAVRSWSAGYELFNTNSPVCYHLWNDNKDKLKETKANRRLISEDNKKDFHGDKKSNARERHLFAMQKSNDEQVLREIEKYGLGLERNLREYERFSGIDFRKRQQREFTKEGMFEKWQRVSKRSEVKKLMKSVDE